MVRRMLAVAALTTMAVGASANAQAIQSFTGGSIFSSYQADGDTIGWYFQANANISVTHLGFWDNPTISTPILLEHPVGIWDSAGTLLGSVTVTPASGAIGDFRYEALGSAVNLTAGSQYYLGAFIPVGNTGDDGYVSSVSNLLVAPEISFLGATRDPDGPQTGLVFPSITSPGVAGRIGPNFLFVPAPGTAALAALGLVALGRRRR